MDKQTDPVCGMQIEAAEAAGQSAYDGQTYYFCAPACQEQFEANPSRFASEAETEER